MASPNPPQPPATTAPPAGPDLMTQEGIARSIREKFSHVDLDAFVKNLGVPVRVVIRCIKEISRKAQPTVDDTGVGIFCPLSTPDLAAELRTPVVNVTTTVRAIFEFLNTMTPQGYQSPNPPPSVQLPHGPLNPPMNPPTAGPSQAVIPRPRGPTIKHPLPIPKVPTLLPSPMSWPTSLPAHIHELHRALQYLYSASTQQGKDLLVFKRADIYAVLLGAKNLDMKGSVMWTELINKSGLSEEEIEKQGWKKEPWYLQGVELAEREDSGEEVVVTGVQKRKRKGEGEGRKGEGQGQGRKKRTKKGEGEGEGEGEGAEVQEKKGKKGGKGVKGAMAVTGAKAVERPQESEGGEGEEAAQGDAE